jgi:oligopeptide/dipeptide ABC transporter ATP-binding protein
MGKDSLKAFRRRAQMVFQDPYQSLNPKDAIFDIVAEPLRVHERPGRSELGERVAAALEDAGLRPAADYAARYPHELSGGQRQRAAIAAALVSRPDFIVADEPVSMLDVSVRAGIVRLMKSLRDKYGLGYVFITHDLSLAWLIADRVAIMYLGKIVETGPAESVIASPSHPYARALVDVMPRLGGRRAGKRAVLGGEPPDPARVPSGCRFHPRCPLAQPRCAMEEPPLVAQGPGDGREVACFYPA